MNKFIREFRQKHSDSYEEYLEGYAFSNDKIFISLGTG
jgi:hypothetical protein